MARRKKNYFSASNRGKAINVFAHNMMAGKSKAEKKEEERICRIKHMMSVNGLPAAYLNAAVKRMKLEGIAINRVEKELIIPWAKEYKLKQKEKDEALSQKLHIQAQKRRSSVQEQKSKELTSIERKIDNLNVRWSERKRKKILSSLDNLKKCYENNAAKRTVLFLVMVLPLLIFSLISFVAFLTAIFEAKGVWPILVMGINLLFWGSITNFASRGAFKQRELTQEDGWISELESKRRNLILSLTPVQNELENS